MMYFILAALCAYGIGFFKGVCDTLQFHWGAGWTHHLKKDQMWWNPQYSWKNKYKNWDAGDKSPRFWGSTTFFVTFTDAWHSFQFYQSMSICGLAATLFLALKNQPDMLDKTWLAIVLFAACKLCIQAGFKTTYR
jgi:hypothetical protein